MYIQQVHFHSQAHMIPTIIITAHSHAVDYATTFSHPSLTGSAVMQPSTPLTIAVVSAGVVLVLLLVIVCSSTLIVILIVMMKRRRKTGGQATTAGQCQGSIHRGGVEGKILPQTLQLPPQNLPKLRQSVSKWPF